MFFHIRSHGYEYPEDRFGYRGFRCVVTRGKRKRVQLRRINIAERLYRVINPMLFFQGDRDRNCDLPVLRATLGRVGAPVQLHVIKDADHTLKVPKKSGRSVEEVAHEVLVTLEGWMKKTLGDTV